MASACLVKNWDDSISQSLKDQLYQWEDHFTMLLNCLLPAVPLPFEDEQEVPVELPSFIQEEIQITVHKLKSENAPGVCNITVQALPGHLELYYHT